MLGFEKTYRGQLRGMGKIEIMLQFVDLQMTEERLVKRMEQRTGHHMSAEIVSTELEKYEVPAVEETGVILVDPHCGIDDVVEEISALL